MSGWGRCIPVCGQQRARIPIDRPRAATSGQMTPVGATKQHLRDHHTAMFGPPRQETFLATLQHSSIARIDSRQTLSIPVPMLYGFAGWYVSRHQRYQNSRQRASRVEAKTCHSPRSAFCTGTPISRQYRSHITDEISPHNADRSGKTHRKPEDIARSSPLAGNSAGASANRRTLIGCERRHGNQRRYASRSPPVRAWTCIQPG